MTALLVDTHGGQRRFEPGGPSIVVGRDPLCHLTVEDSRVSRQHLAMEWTNGHWSVRDLGSSNGTFLDGRRIHTLLVDRPCTLHLGDASNGAALSVRLESVAPAPGPNGAAPLPTVLGSPIRVERPITRAADRPPSAVYQLTGRVRIGRAPDNDIVLTDLLVSRNHAELRRTDAGFEVVDLGTRNGTFVNGRRVTHAVLRPADLVSAGHHQLIFDGDQLREYVDTGRVSLRAEDLTVTVAGKTLLRGVNFELAESSLLAVVGPSGAGKSTLLNALTGIRPANHGMVHYENRDLYAEYDDLRHRIGLVPQDDILHKQLTVRRALGYAAALRFGSDVTTAEREQRIDEVLAKLGLTGWADQRISTLSGGQRKRTSVGLELLTEPSLLFLDEPTSGLDPALDRDVMVALRDLADGGRTVCVVTHSVLHLGVCDRVLVLGTGGLVTYFGPPDGLLEFFGAREYAEVFEQVAREPELWAARYAEHAGDAAAPSAERATLVNPSPTEDRAGAAPARQSFWRQLSIVARRTGAVTLSDKLYASLLIGLPLGLAGLMHVVPGDSGLATPANVLKRSVEASQLLTILVIGAVFMGLAGGIRELVAERAIYRRERAVGLMPSAYIGAKLTVFAVANAAQAALFVLAGLSGRAGPEDALVLGSPTLELIVVIAMVTLTSTVLGLLVSAYVSTSEQTMPVLVGLVMAQLVLCGGLFAVADRAVIAQVSWLAPARWAYAALASSVDLKAIMVDPPADALWQHTTGHWLLPVGILVAQTLVLLIATRLALRRQDPGR